MPRWRSDGKELFFVGGDDKMMAVTVKTTAGPRPVFEAGAPTALFEAHVFTMGTNAMEYDVTADGKRFLIATAGAEGSASPPVTVVTNWSATKRK